MTSLLLPGQLCLSVDMPPTACVSLLVVDLEELFLLLVYHHSVVGGSDAHTAIPGSIRWLPSVVFVSLYASDIVVCVFLEMHSVDILPTIGTVVDAHYWLGLCVVFYSCCCILPTVCYLQHDYSLLGMYEHTITEKPVLAFLRPSLLMMNSVCITCCAFIPGYYLCSIRTLFLLPYCGWYLET